ncbi:MAG: hypothetical protein KAS32_28315, partial [Candidatus Peribacteraceae bacterium]|nr:hypothetical protein [Candidatus Peribacteraceae bacterium]
MENQTTEILPPAIEITEVSRIFAPNPIVYFIDGERRLSEILLDSSIPVKFMSVSVNGKWVTRDLWARAIIEPGDKVLIRLLPQGGEDGVKIAQTVVSIVAVFAAIWFPPAAMLGAFVNIALSIAFPPPTQPLAGDPGELQNSPQLMGARNSIRQWMPIQVVIGKEYRVWPSYAARPYTEVVGGEHFFRAI